MDHDPRVHGGIGRCCRFPGGACDTDGGSYKLVPIVDLLPRKIIDGPIKDSPLLPPHGQDISKANTRSAAHPLVVSISCATPFESIVTTSPYQRGNFHGT